MNVHVHVATCMSCTCSSCQHSATYTPPTVLVENTWNSNVGGVIDIQTAIRPYQINCCCSGPTYPKFSKSKRNYFNTVMFSLLGLGLVLRGSGTPSPTNGQPSEQFSNKRCQIYRVFNDIHVFFVLFCLPIPALPFHLGRLSNNKLIWCGLTKDCQ